MRTRIFFLSVFLFLFLFPLDAFALDAGPYSGRVVDSQTGRPIEGASVLIFWTEKVYSFTKSKTKLFKAQLAYTDKAGGYRIPQVYLGLGLLNSVDKTSLAIYQPGYRFFRAQFSGQSAHELNESGRTVRLDRIPPDFSHPRHYRAIQDALSGMDEYPYSYPRKEDLFMSWKEFVGNKMRGSAEKQEFMRRAEWENRSGTGLQVLSGSMEENLSAIKKWNELLSGGTAKEKKLALGNLAMLRYYDFNKNFGLYKPALDSLRDSDPFVREAAASLIGSVSKPGISGRRTFKGTPVIPALLEAVKDRHPRVRAMAASALAYQADTRAVQPLIALLKDGDPFVRLNAAFALGELKAPGSVSSLLEMLCDDSVPDYKYAQQEAVGAISRINTADKKTLAVLKKKAEDKYLKAGIATALAMLRPAEEKVPVEIEAVEKPKPAAVPAQHGIESNRKDGLVSPIIATSPHNNKSEKIEMMAEKTPYKGKVDAHTNSPDNRRSQTKVVAAASEVSKDESSEMPLSEKLQDGDPRTREAAVRSLMAAGEITDSLRCVIQGLQSDPDPDVRAAALLCPVFLDKKCSNIRDLLSDDSRQVKLIALKEIEKTRQKDAAEAVSRLLDDPDSAVASEAARVLGELGNKESVEPLIKAAGTGNTYLREAAIASLGELGSPEAVPALIDIYKNKEMNPSLRKAAATALCRIKDKRAVPVFIASLESDDWGEFYGAVNALSEIGGGEAIKALVLKLMNGNNKEIIIEALAASYDERALGVLASLFDSPDNKVSSAAIRAALRTDKSDTLSGLFKWMEKDPVRKDIILSLLAGPDNETCFQVLEARSGDKDPLIKKGAAAILSSRLKGVSLQTTRSR